ncbi:hypothetical protein CEP53_001946 [Fusarium sp. AF-6]|nr:hypothetical protein CEP53_001946 [Fusarium sp. AF-6]
MHNNLDVLQHDGRPAKSARIPRLDNDRGIHPKMWSKNGLLVWALQTGAVHEQSWEQLKGAISNHPERKAIWARPEMPVFVSSALAKIGEFRYQVSADRTSMFTWLSQAAQSCDDEAIGLKAPKRTRASREDVTLFCKKLKLDPTDRKSRNKASLELRRRKRSEAEQTDEQPQLSQPRDSRWPLDKIESGDSRSLALAFQQAARTSPRLANAHAWQTPTPGKRSVAFFKSGADAMMTRLSWINEYKYTHENPTLLPSLVHSGGSRHEPSRFQFSCPNGDCDAQESTEMRLQAHMRECSQVTSEPLRKDEGKPVPDQAGQSTSDEHDNFALGDDEQSSPTTHQHFFFKFDDVFDMELAISDAVVQLGKDALEIWEQARNHDYKSNVEIWGFLLQPEEIVHVGSEAVDSNNKKLDSQPVSPFFKDMPLDTTIDTSSDFGPDVPLAEVLQSPIFDPDPYKAFLRTIAERNRMRMRLAQSLSTPQESLDFSPETGLLIWEGMSNEIAEAVEKELLSVGLDGLTTDVSSFQWLQSTWGHRLRLRDTAVSSVVGNYGGDERGRGRRRERKREGERKRGRGDGGRPRAPSRMRGREGEEGERKRRREDGVVVVK